MIEVRLDDFVDFLSRKDNYATPGSEEFLITADRIRREVLDNVDMYSKTLQIKIE
jgi:hypothetical protein